MRFMKEVLLVSLFSALPALAQEPAAPVTAQPGPDAAPKAEKAQRARSKRTHTPATRLTAQMERDLALDGDQAAKVKDINDSSMKALRALRPTEEEIKQSRRQQRQILAERDAQLKAILSDQQYAELTANREKYEKRMRNMRPADAP